MNSIHVPKKRMKLERSITTKHLCLVCSKTFRTVKVSGQQSSLFHDKQSFRRRHLLDLSLANCCFNQRSASPRKSHFWNRLVPRSNKKPCNHQPPHTFNFLVVHITKVTGNFRNSEEEEGIVLYLKNWIRFNEWITVMDG